MNTEKAIVIAANHVIIWERSMMMMKTIGKRRCGGREVEIEPTIEVVRWVGICHDLGEEGTR